MQKSGNNDIATHLLAEALQFDPNQSKTIYSYFVKTSIEKINANNLGIVLSLLKLIADNKYLKDKQLILSFMWSLMHSDNTFQSPTSGYPPVKLLILVLKDHSSCAADAEAFFSLVIFLSLKAILNFVVLIDF